MTNVISIVSGLPRSGTSMMMRMLEAGGMGVVVDHIRVPDIDNPNGYYEFEKIKKIKEDDSWLADSDGKVIKAVSMLLYELPPDRRYRIVFMRRNMEEILASQRKMLARQGKGHDFSEKEMRLGFTRHLSEIEQWLNKQPNMEVLFVNYNEIMETPRESVIKINKFFNDSLKVDEMLKVVNKSLYRQRAGAADKDSARDDARSRGAEQNDNADEDEKIKEQLRNLGYL